MNLTYSILSHEADEWIIAFYGYGQQAEVFRPLATKVKKSYNVLVVDLPLQTLKKSIAKKTFIQFIDELTARYNIKKITGISYSMGSRFNLVMAEYLPERIHKLMLVAPDGIRMRLWNKFSTSTHVGNFIFSYLVKSKHAYSRCILFLYRMKLMPKSMYAFSKWHMRDVVCRTKVYNAWMNMREMMPDLITLKKKKTEFNFDIVAYFGKYDTIINTPCQEKLKRKIPSTKIITLDKGHNLLDEELFDDIATFL